MSFYIDKEEMHGKHIVMSNITNVVVVVSSYKIFFQMSSCTLLHNKTILCFED